MATTAQWVYEKTVYLLDEQDQDSGRADTAANRLYKDRVLPMLNILQDELAAFSEGYCADGRRKALPEIKEFTDEIALDDGICRAVMPYGLAALLFLEEYPEAAAFFHQRYSELKLQLARQLGACAQPIENLYGALGV